VPKRRSPQSIEVFIAKKQKKMEEKTNKKKVCIKNNKRQ
jgi:hypothetical protein